MRKWRLKVGQIRDFLDLYYLLEDIEFVLNTRQIGLRDKHIFFLFAASICRPKYRHLSKETPKIDLLKIVVIVLLKWLFDQLLWNKLAFIGAKKSLETNLFLLCKIIGKFLANPWQIFGKFLVNSW